MGPIFDRLNANILKLLRFEIQFWLGDKSKRRGLKISTIRCSLESVKSKKCP